MSAAAEWNELRDLADADRLDLMFRNGGVEIWNRGILATPFLVIRPVDLVAEDADIVVRAATRAALAALKGLPQ